MELARPRETGDVALQGKQLERSKRVTVDFKDTIRITSWVDPMLDNIGYDPRSSYVEHFWLPILGPSSIWLLRRARSLLEMNPTGITLSCAELGGSLGLGDTKGRSSLLTKTVQRCVDFEVAKMTHEGSIAFRRRLAPLSVRQLQRLPKSIAELHPSVSREVEYEMSLETLRAERLAATLFELGETPDSIVIQLTKWNFSREVTESAICKYRESQAVSH